MKVHHAGQHYCAKEIELDSRYQFPLELLVSHCSKIEDLYQALLIYMDIY